MFSPGAPGGPGRIGDPVGSVANGGGGLETTAAAVCRAIFDLAPEPKEILIFPGNAAHANQLFTSPDGEQLKQKLFAFFDQLK